MEDDVGEVSSSDSGPASMDMERLMGMAATNNDGAAPLDLVASAVGEKDAIDLLGTEDKMLRIMISLVPEIEVCFNETPSPLAVMESLVEW